MTVVAWIFDDAGQAIDFAHTWQTAQVYANAGHRVLASAPDGGMDVTELQDLLDYELRIAEDCFGPGIRTNF